MVRWLRHWEYFFSLAEEQASGSEATANDVYDYIVNDFAAQYNCKLEGGYMLCSEEDFLIIQLAHSNAVGMIVND